MGPTTFEEAKLEEIEPGFTCVFQPIELMKELVDMREMVRGKREIRNGEIGRGSGRFHVDVSMNRGLRKGKDEVNRLHMPVMQQSHDNEKTDDGPCNNTHVCCPVINLGQRFVTASTETCFPLDDVTGRVTLVFH